jgi:DNA adenine methylase
MKGGKQLQPLRGNVKEDFLLARKQFNETKKFVPVHQYEDWLGETFYYLNTICFNGLCRYNKSGDFNVHFGDMKYPRIRLDTSPYASESMFRSWSFLACSFNEPPPPVGSFVYADPPYYNTFNSYTKEGFTWVDQVRLCKMLREHTGPVVVSNSNDERIMELYKRHGYDVQEIQSMRKISCNGARPLVMEMLATRGL